MSNRVTTHPVLGLFHPFIAKSSISVIFFVYCVSILSQLIISFSSSKSYADTARPLSRMIAVIVDTSIYDSFKVQVDRYASRYLQAQYSDSKALVIPLESDNFQAQDIHKILQNLYFDGQQGVPSELIGVSLIGDIALPVVNDSGFYYPTIYPYIDFLNPQFVYSEQDGIFIVNPQGTKNNPELWHNLIRFDSQTEYNSFFQKLGGYAARPPARVSDKVRVDDLVQEQKSYNQGLINNYANQFVFAEDLGRQRYTNLLTDMTNGNDNDKVADIFIKTSLTSIDPPTNNANDIPQNLSDEQYEVAQNLKGYFQRIGQLAKLLAKKKPLNPNTFDTTKVAGIASSQGVPTLFNQQIMDGYLRNYPDLYSEEYHASINNLVEPSGRYYNSGDRVGVNSHIWKTYQQDELAKTIIINLNDQLEQTADTFIESEKVYMTVPVPTKMLQYRPPNTSRCATTRGLILDEVFDVSYFGSDPSTSQNIQDMMIFRGTFNNISILKELEGYDYLFRSPYISDDQSDKLKASIGATYGFQSREVEANRGYNPMLVEQDMNTYLDAKPKILAGTNECNARQLEDLERYIQWYWGGYTPLNLLEEKVVENGRLQLDISKLNHLQIRSPSFAVNGMVFGGTAYDIAGSRALTKERILNITAGTEELSLEYKVDSDWVAPSECDELVDGQGSIVNEYSKILENYNQTCTGDNPTETDPRICEEDRQNLVILESKINSYKEDPENLALINKCTNIVEPYIVVSTPYSKVPIKLKGLSDNYLAYQTFAATQKTTNRPDYSIKKRYYSSYVVKNLHQYQGQDGISYSVAEAIEKQSIKPLLYCDGDKKKKSFIFDTVEFFVNINRDPRDGEKIRMMMNPVGGDNSINPPTAQEIEIASGCSLIYNKIDDLEEEKAKRAKEWRKALLPSILVYNDLTNIAKQIKSIELANPECFNENEDVFTYINANDNKCSGKRYNIMHDYYYETMPSLYVHKAPTKDDLYGKELKELRGVQQKYAYPNPEAMKGNERRRRFKLDGYQFDGIKVEVDSMSFILIPGDDFIAKDNKLYFTDTASLPLYGKDVSLKDTMGIYTNFGKTLVLTGTDAPLTRYERDNGGRKPFEYQRYGAMNIGTSERPIDSVRYSSFQGIGGDLVKLMYPNLYNVTVFSATGVLLTEDLIKENIQTYLVSQAKIYRKKLAEQQDKSAGFFQTQAKGFSHLAKVDPYASPLNRPGYDLTKITDDFFIKGLTVTVGGQVFTSDDVLTILARNLYYQNLISPLDQSSPILEEELNNLYSTISIDNINSKRKFIFSTYLQNNSHLTNFGAPRIKSWDTIGGLLIPSYDKDGYEIASITSNGSDYHVDPTLNPLLRLFTLTSDATQASPRQESSESNLAPLVCNGKSYDRKGVSLLQYPKAFQCWLEDIKTNSIKVTVNGDLVDLIKTVDQSGWNAALTGYFADQLGYVNQMLDYPQEMLEMGENVSNAMASIVSKEYRDQTKSVNFGAERYQVWRGAISSKSGVNYLAQDPVYDPTALTNSSKALSTVVNNLSIDAGATTIPINSTGLDLSILLVNTTPLFDVTLSGTGSACIVLDGINTCSQPVQLTNRGAKSGQNLSYDLRLAPGATIGDAGLIATICVQGDSRCVEYPLIYRITPGVIAKINFIDILKDSYLARGSQIPLIIQGFDSMDNILSLAPDPYRIKATKGQLRYMGQKFDEVDVNTWKSLVTIYDSSSLSQGTQSDTIQVSPVMAGGLLPVFDFTIKIAEPVLELTTPDGPRAISQGFEIALPSVPNTYTRLLPNNETSYVPAAIPKIRLGLAPVNGQPVLGTIRISSQNGLVRPGVLGARMISGTNNDQYEQIVWSDQDTYVITGDSQEIYLYPSFVAGKDIIQVTIGDKLWSIPITVLPGDPAGVVITAPETLNHNTTGNISFAATDYRGNKVQTDTWLDLGVYGYKLTLFGATTPTQLNSFGGVSAIQTKNGLASIKVVPQAIIGKGYITAQVQDIPLDQQRSDYVGILVQSILRPTKRINSLVLQLKGNDWGNILSYQTDTTLKAPSLIGESDKLLSVVTNLVDPHRIKQTKLMLNPHGAMAGEESSDAVLTLGLGHRSVSTSQGLAIKMGSAQGYTLAPASTTILDTAPLATSPHLYYIPTTVDSHIFTNQVSQNKLIINDQVMLDLDNLLMHPDIRIHYRSKTPYDAGVYDVMYHGRSVGTMIFYRADNLLIQELDFIEGQLPETYEARLGYGGGSSNADQVIHIVKSDSVYQNDHIPLEQNSLIAQFGQGLSVGNATKQYDQFSITFGDAALSRSTINVPAYALVSDMGKPVRHDLPYDTGIGEIIYHDPDKSIDRVESIDFNNDGLNDLLIVYEDGSIRLLKNYGGKQPRRDLGHLMIISDGIEELFVGDVDNNNFQDIIVHTQQGKLRVYYNTNGQFDVDGYPVCLDVAGGPDDLSQLYYRTIRDMDLDNSIDIVTYDHHGDIKIFYGGGGGSGKGSSYVSKTRGLCDGDWKQRQSSKLVQSFGLNIISQPIQDESLIHWSSHVKGDNPYDVPEVERNVPSYYDDYDKLTELEDSTTPVMSDMGGSERAGLSKNFDDYVPPVPKEPKDFNAKAYAKSITSTMIQSFDVSKAVNNAYEDATRYTPVPESLRPTYPTVGSNLYIQSKKLTIFDPVNVKKQFEDMNGGVLIDRDLVRVTVKITGPVGTQFAYLDKLTGPWVVPLSSQGTLEGESQDFAIHASSITYNHAGYIFTVNSASIDGDGVVEFSYVVQYRNEKLADVEVVSVPATYPQIRAKSLDGCQKSEWLYINDGGRSYTMNMLDYKALMIRDQTASYQLYDKSTFEQTEEIITSMGEEDGPFDYVKERRNNDNVFERAVGIIDGTYLQSIPTQLRIGLQSGSKEMEIGRMITKFTNGLCNGFKQGSSSCAGTTSPGGLPFNMAIPGLTPGVVNAMGYGIILDRGLPLLAFPTKGAPPIRPPMPKGAGGWFDIHKVVPYSQSVNSTTFATAGQKASQVRSQAKKTSLESPGTTANVSQFRLYMTPTLTASFGMAICFGPYASVGMKLPAPFKNVAGNCIVYAFEPKRKSQQQCVVESRDDFTPAPQLDLPTCYGDLQTDVSKFAATQMIIANEQSQSWLNQQRTNISPSDVYGQDAREIYAASHPGIGKAIAAFNGVINLNAPAKVMDSEQVFALGNNGLGMSISDVGKKLISYTKPGTSGVAKIREIGKGIQKGVGACIVQIADNQIQYVKNNLLTSSLTVVLPDLTRLGISNDWNDGRIWTDGGTIKDNRDTMNRGLKQVSPTDSANRSLYEFELAEDATSESLLTMVDKAQVNPFYHIEQLFNDMKLISISQQDTWINIPFIRTTDLNLYKSEISGRYLRNKTTIEQWNDYAVGLAKECGGLSDPTKRKECSELLAQVVYINDQFGQMVKSINANNNSIKQYTHFQTVALPIWKENQIIYLQELTSVVDSVMSQLAGWATQNSARFTAWTSSIRSMIIAVKTRQLLVDFSKNWSERCGTCRTDNYDFATCSLSGLCPNFPLFAWPNFRTPDFTIDLSRIDAGVELVIPNFKFRPVDVPLFKLIDLPDLPLPPQLGSPIYAQLNIILPSIPVLPPPPPLPDLPSFSMQVDMDLPLLPPAPKIPMLPETLNAAVQVADFIGRILCIVKGDFGLVGESFVKHKIEQVTARTWSVSPFDSISAIISQPRPQGYNARIDAYVNLRFYFDGLYNVFDELGSQFNRNQVGFVQQGFKDIVNNSAEFVNGKISDVKSGVVQGLSSTPIAPLLDNQIPLKFNGTIKPLGYQEFDERLIASLTQFSQTVENTSIAEQASRIIGMIKEPVLAQANLEGLEKIHTQSQQIISEALSQSHKEYQIMQQSYDDWLDTLVSDQYVSDTRQNTELSSSLYTINPEVQELIESSDMRQEYLQTNKDLLGRYQLALTNQSTNELGVDASTHLKMKEYVNEMVDKTDFALSQHQLLALEEGPRDDQLNPNDTDEAPDSGSSNEGGSAGGGASVGLAKQYSLVGFDQSNQRDGYLVDVGVKVSDGYVKAAVNVIKPEGLGTQYRDRSIELDINKDYPRSPDIIVWDSDTVYVKYAIQNPIHVIHNQNTQLYLLPRLTSPTQLAQLVNSTDGYLSYDPGLLSQSIGFKVRSSSYALTNFRLYGQEYDNAIFQWSNPTSLGQPRNEIYLIRITTLVDRHPDERGPVHATKYLIVVPSGLTLDPKSTKIMLPGTKRERTIQELLTSKTLHDVVSFDSQDEMIAGILHNLPREWYYAQGLRMELSNGRYLRTSARSNQDVGGLQIAGDSIAPTPEAKLIRVSTNEEVSGGSDLKGFINTAYDLELTWTDNVSIARSSVGGVAAPRATRTEVKRIYQQKPTTLHYNFSATDSSNNVTSYVVTVTIQNPTLETINATATYGTRGTVTAKLTPDLDDGIIQFQQKNIDTRSTLVALPGGEDGYQVEPFKTIYTGGLYQFPNSWGLKNADGSNAGTVDGQGQVSSDDLQMLVRFPQGYPVISMIMDKGGVVYDLTYASLGLTGSQVVIKTPSLYRLLSLKNFNTAIAGAFAQGQCIAPQLGECEIFVSPRGDVWIDPSVRQYYYGTYVWQNGHGVYQIIRDKVFVAEIHFIPDTIK